MITIRPRAVDMAEGERIAYSEMMAHGAYRPRPERPAFCAEFEKRIHGWSYRTLVKPGLSDLAQVRGGYDLLPKEKVALDLWRVGYPSLRIALVTDPPYSSIISTALRFCSSV